MKILPIITISFGSLNLILTCSALAQTDHCEDEETYYKLSEALKEPEKVIKLDIAMKKLTKISPDIGKLTNLECLDLSFNRISDLPAEFSELKKLRFLNLTGTRYLPGLPKVLSELPGIEVIDISDHPEWSPAQFENAKKMLPDVEFIIADK